MRRWLGAALLFLPLVAASRPAAAFLYVSGSNGRSGDLIGVWVKNGFEVIQNLGPVESIGLGTVKSFEVPAEFDGNLTGAKFTALAVPNPDAVFTGLGLDPPPPKGNIALTTLGDPETITSVQVGDAQAALDPPVGGQTWLNNLNSIPPAGSTGVISNNDGAAVISSTLFAAYTATLGFTTDAIANTMSLSTAVLIDPLEEGDDYAIPLYEVAQTLTDVGGGNFDFGTQVTQIGVLAGDAGDSGSTTLSLQEAPEPAGIALGAVALAALGAVRRRRA
jgi:MYXO-CTERM domain-containing protein